jgi:hypothetical protein
MFAVREIFVIMHYDKGSQKNIFLLKKFIRKANFGQKAKGNGFFAKMAKDVIDSTLLTRDGIFKLLRSPGIDSKKSIQPAYVACAGILEQSMGARNRVGIGLSYWPARLHRLEESIPWNRFDSWSTKKF